MKSQQAIFEAVIQKCEELTRISAWCDPDLLLRPHTVVFEFQSAALAIHADGMDDTVVVASAVDCNGLVRCDDHVAHLESQLRGARLTWARHMVNQRNYVDGVQLEFSPPYVGVVLIAEASCLEVFRVERIE